MKLDITTLKASALAGLIVLGGALQCHIGQTAGTKAAVTGGCFLCGAERAVARQVAEVLPTEKPAHLLPAKASPTADMPRLPVAAVEVVVDGQGRDARALLYIFVATPDHDAPSRT